MRRIISVTAADWSSAKAATSCGFAAEFNADGSDATATHFLSETGGAHGDEVINDLEAAGVPYIDAELSDDVTTKQSQKATFLSGIGILIRGSVE